MPEDEVLLYREEGLRKLYQAQEDPLCLTERGYPMKDVSVLTGNHYLPPGRQRFVLVRVTSSRQVTASRGNQGVIGSVPGKEVYTDDPNIIIIPEIALSSSMLLKRMDGIIRDLTGLRGIY